MKKELNLTHTMVAGFHTIHNIGAKFVTSSPDTERSTDRFSQWCEAQRSKKTHVHGFRVKFDIDLHEVKWHLGRVGSKFKGQSDDQCQAPI